MRKLRWGIVGSLVGATSIGLPAVVFLQAGGSMTPDAWAILAFAIVASGWTGAFFEAGAR